MNSILDYLDHFQFEDAPLTSLPTVITVITSYLSLLYVLQSLMKAYKPQRMEKLFILHNSLLSFASAILLLAITPIIAKHLYTEGLFFSICDRFMAYNPRLNFFYYVNYLMKFWELADTFFLVARKKKLEFLHV
jgi:fatty acid elongase 3